MFTFTPITPGCHTVSKKSTPVNSWFLSVPVLPQASPHSSEKMGKSSLHLCLGKRGRGLLCASVAFQNEDSSTHGPKELTFLYTELFSYPTWDMLRGKNILGILSIPLSLFRSERPSIPLYGSPGAFSCHPRFIFLAQSSSLHSRLLSR